MTNQNAVFYLRNYKDNKTTVMQETVKKMSKVRQTFVLRTSNYTHKYSEDVVLLENFCDEDCPIGSLVYFLDNFTKGFDCRNTFFVIEDLEFFEKDKETSVETLQECLLNMANCREFSVVTFTE